MKHTGSTTFSEVLVVLIILGVIAAVTLTKCRGSKINMKPATNAKPIGQMDSGS